jgi:flagellum-specific peptidoglycan hydrolase FlgJ
MKLSSDNKQNRSLISVLAGQMYQGNPIQRDLMVAQAILESSLLSLRGPSGLALNHQNLFGIKYPSSQKNIDVLRLMHAEPVNMATTEYTDTKIRADFIHFVQIEDSMKYRKYMLTWSIYRNVGDATSFKDAADRISKSGYATDPKYTKSLIDIYNNFIK